MTWTWFLWVFGMALAAGVGFVVGDASGFKRGLGIGRKTTLAEAELRVLEAQAAKMRDMLDAFMEAVPERWRS